MIERIVESAEDADRMIADAASEGLRLAAISNAGLKGAARRLTFLPVEAFRGAPITTENIHLTANSEAVRSY